MNQYIVWSIIFPKKYVSGHFVWIKKIIQNSIPRPAWFYKILSSYLIINLTQYYPENILGKARFTTNAKGLQWISV